MSSNIDRTALDSLLAMGYPEADAREALIACNNDVSAAVEFIAEGFDTKPNDNEFDLMIDDHGINQQVQPPTVFKPRTEAEGPDHFRDDGSRTLGSIIDSRVKSLSEMGFSEEEAEDALNNCNGDVNEALNLLLSR